MQEAAAKYQGEGFSHIYYALAGTDTQVLIDMLSEMFGEPTTMEPEELDSASVKRQCTSAMEEEEKLAEASVKEIPAKGPPRSIQLDLKSLQTMALSLHFFPDLWP